MQNPCITKNMSSLKFLLNTGTHHWCTITLLTLKLYLESWKNTTLNSDIKHKLLSPDFKLKLKGKCIVKSCITYENIYALIDVGTNCFFKYALYCNFLTYVHIVQTVRKKSFPHQSSKKLHRALRNSNQHLPLQWTWLTNAST